MKTSETFWMFLPVGLEELFEMVRFKRTEQAYDVWIDEKKKFSDEDFRNPNIVARVYTEYVTVQDYPLRGRPVFLHMLKNKWQAGNGGQGGKGTLAAANIGTRSDEIISILINAMGMSVIRWVKDMTCDLSPSMMLIAVEVFYNTSVVNDRFHVRQIYKNQSRLSYTPTWRLCVRYLRAASIH